MTKCMKCGDIISDEESKARYEELSKMGIVPMMIPICKSCRDLPTRMTWKKWRELREKNK